MSLARTLAFTLVFTAACGADTTPGPTGPTATQACTALAQAECARRDACSNHFLIGRVYGDLATCEQRVRDACVTSLAAHGTGQTPSNVQACATAYPSIACADYFNNTNLPASCFAQPGTLANGAACRYASQCQSAFCAVPTGTSCGVCAARPAAGAPCNGPGAPVGCGGHGLTCVGETATAPGTCVALGAMGATCDLSHPCGSGLSCTPVAIAAPSRTCQPAGAEVGVACGGASASGCDNERGLACNTMSRTCQNITLVAAGAACGVGADGGFSSCANSGDCMGYTLATLRGTCRATAADGAACDRAAGPYCRTPASCVTPASGGAATCALPSSASCG
ncbi:MAG: hypothetical protein U0326_18725 [Polyangiales bacterium]